MILGVGTDIIDIHRIHTALQRTGFRFIERVLAHPEIEYYEKLSTKSRQAEFVAGRFAAKEAIGKAMGIGLGRLGPTEVAVTLGEEGLSIQWLGQHHAKSYSEDNWRISISHGQNTAVAFAVWERIAET